MYYLLYYFNDYVKKNNKYFKYTQLKKKKN